MTLARKQQISLEHTAYYHCTSRCVRRAFLCGKDRFTGESFEHRRAWIEKRLKVLTDIFAIDVLAYAIMSNHYHVVLRLRPSTAVAWSDAEVLERWRQLYKGQHETREHLQRYRQRLANISWFMRCINERMARCANREDGCKGRFWEGRFKSQALLDETAVLKCMAYVDLNPVRAGIARTPEASDYTSIKARIEQQADHLLPFVSDPNANTDPIPIKETDYLQLVDWSGRVLRPQKRGAIPANAPDILVRLKIEPADWATEMRHYGRWYCRAVGSITSLRRYCEHLGRQWLKGIAHATNNAA